MRNVPGNLIFCALLACALPAGSRADTGLPEFTLSGFGTLGLAHNSTGGAEYRRDLLQPGGPRSGWSGNVDSRVGLQLNARFRPDLELVLQGISKYTHDGDHDPELSWGFLSYSPDPSLKLRAGRLGWDAYLLTDSRDIGYSYTWIRPPNDYFGKLLLSHFDGGDFAYHHPFGGGVVTAKLYGGRATEKVPVGGGREIDLSGSTIIGGNITFHVGDWLLRASYSETEIDGELPNFLPLLDALRASGLPAAADIADELELDNTTVHDFSAGGAWEHGPWQAQLMYNRLESHSLVLATTQSAYFFLGYRHGRWNPYFVASGTLTHEADRSTGLPLPNPLDAALGVALDKTQAIQRTLSAGVRFDFMPNADLKLQLDHVHVYDDAAGLWIGPRPGWDGDATLFTLTVDFVF